jgi:hypothetical protein
MTGLNVWLDKCLCSDSGVTVRLLLLAPLGVPLNKGGLQL